MTKNELLGVNCYLNFNKIENLNYLTELIEEVLIKSMETANVSTERKIDCYKTIDNTNCTVFARI